MQVSGSNVALLFLSRQLILRVMEEDLASKTRRNLKQVAEVEGFSDGFLRLGPPPFLKGSCAPSASAQVGEIQDY